MEKTKSKRASLFPSYLDSKAFLCRSGTNYFQCRFSNSSNTFKHILSFLADVVALNVIDPSQQHFKLCSIDHVSNHYIEHAVDLFINVVSDHPKFGLSLNNVDVCVRERICNRILSLFSYLSVSFLYRNGTIGIAHLSEQHCPRLVGMS